MSDLKEICRGGLSFLDNGDGSWRVMDYTYNQILGRVRSEEGPGPILTEFNNVKFLDYGQLTSVAWFMQLPFWKEVTHE